MRAFGVVAIALLVACSSSSSTSSGDDDGGTTPIGSSSSSGGTQDAGSCLLVVGPQSGTTVQVVSRGTAGAADWATPNEVLATDGKVATATLDSATESQEIRVTNFGFTFPADGKIMGVEVWLDRQATGTVYDGAVSLLVDGQTPMTKYYEPAWPTKIIGQHKYGGRADLWNVAFTPAMINSPTFGAAIWVKHDTATGAASASIDGLRIAVYYCPGS